MDGARLDPGTQLAHYRIERAIGEGAMGVVYRAHDLGLDRPVALKVLKTDVSEDEEFVRRFVSEARAAARVAHPNLTHVYFVGEQNGLHFFAMEYVTGRDLESVIAQDGPLRVEEALEIATQAAQGLGVAHAAGVIHRDVKPSNILLQANGQVRITDFGLAKSLDADVSSTRAGQVIGTPTFMSPEQCRGRRVDPRTDVYALGLTLWFLITGRHPYSTDAIGELINNHINTPLPSASDVRPDVPAGLDDALALMTAKDPDRRPFDMKQVTRILQPFRAQKVQRAPLLSRGLAAFVDLVLVGIVGVQIQYVLQKLLGIQEILESVWGSMLLAALFGLYHLGCEARWQQTVGKWLLQIHVVSRVGTPPPRRTLIPRFLLRYPLAALTLVGFADLGFVFESISVALQLAAVLLGVGWYLWSSGRTLSDALTRTRVAIRMREDDDEDEEA